MVLTVHAFPITDTLLERDEALAALSEAFDEAQLGRGRLLFIAGEAGAGKTTLVRAFCQTLGTETCVLTGACDALSTPRPLGPLLDVTAGGSGALADLVRLGAPPSDVYAALRDELAGQPTVLVLEDLHWADEATLDVLRLLGRRIETLPALVVATYRNDGLDRAHPIRVLVGDLATAPFADRLILEPLSPAAVTQLAFGHSIDPDELYLRTGGNPFFVAQTLEAGATEVPATVRDAILARTARLSPDATALVEVAAIAPPQVEPWLLAAVVGGAVDRLDECVATGLVTTGDSGIAFRHELARLAVEESLTPARRLALHRRVLAALTAPPTGTPALARLAHHAEAAQDFEAVLTFAPAAAASAASAGAYREAAAQYARALRFADGLPPGKRAELLERRSDACYLADDQWEAVVTIREAVECRRLQGDAPGQADALAELTSYLLCRRLITEAEGAVREATQLVQEDPETPQLGRVYAARAYFCLDRGDFGAAIELARRAIDIAERCGDEKTRILALITLGTTELEFDATRGRETLERAVAAGREHGLMAQVAWALSNLGHAGVSNRWHELANTFLPAALEHSTAHNLDLWRINVLAHLARSELDQGRWTAAAETAALLLHDPRESPWPQFEALLVLALVRARRGDPEAQAALDQARAIFTTPDDFGLVVAFAAAQAEIAWLEQRLGGVDEATAPALALAVAQQAPEAICELTHWRRLAGLDENVPPGATGPFAQALAGEWQQAAAAWTALGSPYEAALALAETGDEDSLRRSLDELQRLGALPASRLVTRRLRALGARGLTRGPRRETRENAAGLTAREVDVVRLVAQGRRNAEIAELLFLSPRTVDHHVSAILRKLDARTRGEAGARAAELGLLEE